MLMILSNLTCQFSKKSKKVAYTFNEYVDMLLCLGASNDNASEAAREYARLYPQGRHPDAKVIRRLMQRLRENGQIMPLYVNRRRPREVRTPALEEAKAIEYAPGRSIRGFLINTIIISGQLKILSLCILVHINTTSELICGLGSLIITS
jgi:hypothetical protein